MKFVTHNTRNIDINNTSLKGYIEISYDELVKKFGPPTTADGKKVDVSWEIQFNDGTIASIYNWKNGKNYMGANGKDVKDITEWNIGGRSDKSVDRVHDLFKKKEKK